MSLKTCGGALAVLSDLFCGGTRTLNQIGVLSYLDLEWELYNVHIENQKAILAGSRSRHKGLQNVIPSIKCTDANIRSNVASFCIRAQHR